MWTKPKMSKKILNVKIENLCKILSHILHHPFMRSYHTNRQAEPHDSEVEHVAARHVF